MHNASNLCTIENKNVTVDACTIMMLRDKLDENETVVKQLVGGDLSQLAPSSEIIYSNDFKKCGWARRLI